MDWLVCMASIVAKCNLQSTIALSSCEAEFYAEIKALAFALFLRAVMVDWGYAGTSIQLFTDSSSAKAFTERLGLGKNRHVQTEWLWIQERLASGDFVLKKVNTHFNLADSMTKLLSAGVMKTHLKNMGLKLRVALSKTQTDAVLRCR